MRLLGIDYGTKRVGIALSDESEHFAFPHEQTTNDLKLITKIIQTCRDKEVEVIVIGESKNYKGENNPVMEKINKFKIELEAELKAAELEVKIMLEPELLTSAEAERIQGKTEMHDASAAALILKSYIDRTNG